VRKTTQNQTAKAKPKKNPEDKIEATYPAERAILRSSMPTAEVTCADANKFVIVDVVIALAYNDGLPWNVMVDVARLPDTRAGN
jgi:hypothetical protein